MIGSIIARSAAAVNRAGGLYSFASGGIILQTTAAGGRFGMIEKAMALFKKHREGILYLFFGGLTTVLGVFLFWLFCYPLDRAVPGLMLGFIGPWLSFVLDAYVRAGMLTARVNRGKWVDIRL